MQICHSWFFSHADYQLPVNFIEKIVEFVLPYVDRAKKGAAGARIKTKFVKGQVVLS